MRSVTEAYRAAFVRLPTPKLTRALLAAVERQQPRALGSLAAEATLRAPGWTQSTDHHRPRQFAGPGL